MADTLGKSKRGSGVRSRKKKRDKVALVLAGGGIPGWMYEIGVLTAMDEFFEDGFSVNDFDIYVGTSAGATVAAILANGVKPRVIYDAVMEDADSPYNFTRKDIYAFGTGETWPMIKKVMHATWSCIREVVGGIVKTWSMPSLLDLIYIVQESLPSGIFTIRPLEKYVKRTLSAAGLSDDFRELKPDLFIPAVDLDRGRYVTFGREGYDHVPISRAVSASSAVPVLFQPVKVDGADYIDGGTGRVANMDVAVDEGAKLLLVLNPVVHLDNDKDSICLPTCYGLCQGLKSKGMSFIADQAMRVNTAMRLRVAKAQQKHMFPDVDIHIIEPCSNETLMFTQNVMGHDTRHDVLRYGYRSTVEHLIRNFAELSATFARHGIKVGTDRFRWRPRAGGKRVLGPNERERTPQARPFAKVD